MNSAPHSNGLTFEANHVISGAFHLALPFTSPNLDIHPVRKSSSEQLKSLTMRLGKVGLEMEAIFFSTDAPAPPSLCAILRKE